MSSSATSKVADSARNKADMSTTTESDEPEQSRQTTESEETSTKASENAAVEVAEDEAPETQAADGTKHAEDELETEQTIDMTNPAKFKWCKIFYQPTEVGVQDHYFQHFDTQEKKWEEPTEPYWVWDPYKATVKDELVIPEMLKKAHRNSQKAPASEPDPNYQGYNPKIHGDYDPNADYAKFHQEKRDEQQLAEAYGDAKIAQQVNEMTGYAATGSFNRFSGGFQTGDKSAERHNDANKSLRQQNAYFDVDAAANEHGGKSLKEERRQQKLSKKEIKERNAKRQEKKMKKKLDFYKS